MDIGQSYLGLWIGQTPGPCPLGTHGIPRWDEADLDITRLFLVSPCSAAAWSAHLDI